MSMHRALSAARNTLAETLAARNAAPTTPAVRLVIPASSDGGAAECKICMDAELNTVLLPCAHRVACEKCARALKICPICRSAIACTIRTYDG